MYIYLSDIRNISDETFDKYYQLSHENTKAKIDFKKNTDDKKRILCKEALVSELLNTRGLTCKDILFSPLGKPYVTHPDIFFSVSHSKNLVACIFSQVETGIDIEASRKVPNSVISRFFSKIEKEKDPLEIWTKKEALSKAFGSGLTSKILKTDVSENSVRFLNDTYYFKTVAINEYTISICNRAPIDDISIAYKDIK